MNLFQKGRSNKGQSTIEYILLVTAVIAVMIFFTTSRNTGVQSHLNATMATAGEGMEDKAAAIADAQVDDAPGAGSNAPAVRLDTSTSINMELP